MILAFQAMCRNEVTIHLIEGKTHSALQMAAFKFAYFVGRPFLMKNIIGIINFARIVCAEIESIFIDQMISYVV